MSFSLASSSESRKVRIGVLPFHTAIPVSSGDLHQKLVIAITTPRTQSATKSVQLEQSAENCFHPLGLCFTEAFDFCASSAKRWVLARARICSLSHDDALQHFPPTSVIDPKGTIAITLDGYSNWGLSPYVEYIATGAFDSLDPAIADTPRHCHGGHSRRSLPRRVSRRPSKRLGGQKNIGDQRLHRRLPFVLPGQSALRSMPKWC